jgi:hypothetical protein
MPAVPAIKPPLFCSRGTRIIASTFRAGYRFIAPVDRLGQAEPLEEEPAVVPQRKRHDRSRGIVAGVLAGAGLIAAV